MVRGGLRRSIWFSVALLSLVAVGVSPVNAAQSDCKVSVSPKSGPAGTVFTFSGSGFKPTDLILHKDDSDAGSHTLSVTSDPWQVTVRSRPGDEGSWSAELDSDACSAVASFKVTLANTDVAASASTAASAPRISPYVPIALLAGGLGVGFLLNRRFKLVAIDNRQP